MAVLRILWKKRNSSLVEELPEVFVGFFLFRKKSPTAVFWKVTYYAQTSLPMQEQLWIVRAISAGKSGLKGS